MRFTECRFGQDDNTPVNCCSVASFKVTAEENPRDPFIPRAPRDNVCSVFPGIKEMIAIRLGADTKVDVRFSFSRGGETSLGAKDLAVVNEISKCFRFGKIETKKCMDASEICRPRNFKVCILGILSCFSFTICWSWEVNAASVWHKKWANKGLTVVQHTHRSKPAIFSTSRSHPRATSNSATAPGGTEVSLRLILRMSGQDLTIAAMVLDPTLEHFLEQKC